MRNSVAVLLATSLALSGCFDAHSGPEGKDSTETGNPPVIDSSLVALVVSEDEVHVTGKAGAVTPGGSELSARNLTSMKVVHGNAADNGSFDLRVDGTRDDVFELRAGSGKQMSAALLVDRGGANVGDSDAGTLSCKQREGVASTQIMQAIGGADTACTTDADCVLVPKGTLCLDSCSDVLVSQKGKADIEAAVDAVNDGVCASYEDDGCVLLALPCEPPDPSAVPACVMGKCELQNGTTGNEMLSCEERSSQAYAAIRQAIEMADLSCTKTADCTLVDSSTDCAGGCSDGPVSLTGKAQFEDAIAAINAGVCANFVADKCSYSMPRCAPIAAPVCSAGQCQPATVLDCDALGAEAGTALYNATQAADRKCSVDDDCVFAGGISCSSGCGGSVVSVQGQAEVAAAVDVINSGLCSTYKMKSCTAPMPSCAFPGVPACDNGTCVENPAP